MRLLRALLSFTASSRRTVLARKREALEQALRHFGLI